MAEAATDIDAVVARYLRRLGRHVQVDAAWIFGSRAQGEPDEGSDIDLAVVSRDFGPNRHADLVLLSRCRRIEDGPMDILPFSLQEYLRLPPGSFLRTVIRRGRLVAGVSRVEAARAADPTGGKLAAGD